MKIQHPSQLADGRQPCLALQRGGIACLVSHGHERRQAQPSPAGCCPALHACPPPPPPAHLRAVAVMHVPIQNEHLRGRQEEEAMMGKAALKQAASVSMRFLRLDQCGAQARGWAGWPRHSQGAALLLPPRRDALPCTLDPPPRTLRRPCARCACRAASAALLSRQKPIWSPGVAWCPGGRHTLKPTVGSAAAAAWPPPAAAALAAAWALPAAAAAALPSSCAAPLPPPLPSWAHDVLPLQPATTASRRATAAPAAASASA